MKVRIARDTLIIAFALSLGAYEIILGGARASVLTFLGGLMLSPLLMRADEARRNDNG